MRGADKDESGNMADLAFREHNNFLEARVAVIRSIVQSYGAIDENHPVEKRFCSNGKCRLPISAVRLKAVPNAMLCTECKREEES